MSFQTRYHTNKSVGLTLTVLGWLLAVILLPLTWRSVLSAACCTALYYYQRETAASMCLVIIVSAFYQRRTLATPLNAMPCHAMPCHAMPCHAMPCHAMPCHAMPCHAMPCNATAGPDGSFVSTGACNLGVTGLNPGRGGYLLSCLCIYSALNCYMACMYSAAYGTVHYKEPLKSFKIRVGHI